MNLPSHQDDLLLNGWYHTIDFGRGMVSKGQFDHRPIVDSYGIPASLKGKTALDVATGDGFFAFEMERRGAERVVAVDVRRIADCDWLPRMVPKVPAASMEATPWATHFAMAHQLLNSSVERVECSVYDLSPERVGMFDVVFCGDLLLHLQNPLKALHNIRAVTKEMLIIETLVDPELEQQYPDRPYIRFGALEMETEPGELNTYWRVNTRALCDMLVYADFPTTRPQPAFGLPPHGVPATSVVALTS